MLVLLLIQEAWRLATGSDVHDVNKAVACYQRYDRECPAPYRWPNRQRIQDTWERWLREYVARKKLGNHR